MELDREFLDYFALWELEQHSEDWPLFRDREGKADELVKEKAASYGGVISISHFMRAFADLKASGKLTQLREPKPPEPPEFTLTAADYNRPSTRDVRLRYQSNPEFKSGVDALIANGDI